MPVSSSRFEAAAYEVPELWEPQWFSPSERERARTLAALLPESARSLLDVGCGNGLFLDEVARLRPSQLAITVGVDRSSAALRHVRAAKCRGSVDALPFCSGSFDVVTCMEVIEHLPEAIFAPALAELVRTSRRFVLVAVPWRENLAAARCRCPKCHALFNPDFHERSFDEAAMATLFAVHGLRMAWTRALGGKRVFVDQLVLSHLERWRDGLPVMPAHAICPECGHHDQAAARHELERRAASDALPLEPRRHSLVRRALGALRPTAMTYRWLAALYERQS